MAAVKTKRISTLIESQLPEFIATEYELFAKFVQKYYEAQEVQGGTLDIINNIQKYADIDFYEKNLLKQNDILTASITSTDTTISVSDASSFPKKNGYIRIGSEVIFYGSRNDTQFLECSRGVSGNTRLGDLYTESDFNGTDAAFHVSGEKVYNVSNLFLYAFVKNFENQYLGSFPEKYLKGEVDKRTLIKNINKFYKAKGTDSSIKFIFNTIISQDVSNKPEVYKPKDFTYKVSKSDWVNVYALKVKVISGDPYSLIGKKVIQEETNEYGYVSATVDNVRQEGKFDGERIWNIILAPETVTGEFAVSTKTRLERTLSQTDGVGKRIDVASTIGWDKTGEVLIGEEVIKFSEKNVTQFYIERRGDITYNHEVGAPVYKPVVISGSDVQLLTLGVVYNFEITDSHPYSSPEDQIQISTPGFQTADPKIVKTGTNQSRWILNQGLPINAPTAQTVVQQLGQTSTDVSAIFEDDQYYYITTSGYPSHKILEGSAVDQLVEDQKLLRIIRKQSTRTTEKYSTPKADVGILLNGVRVYGHRDPESIRYGRLEQIVPLNQGSGYAKPPFVLIDGAPNKARAVLSGSVVERYIVDTKSLFPRTPTVEVTSGRGASVRAVVTGDKITSLIIDEPGEYYSSPPIVRITDNNGKGRFAEYNAIVDTSGRLTGFEKLAEGNFYNQQTVSVEIIAVGRGAVGEPLLKEWNYNRYEKLKNSLDPENGYLFKNYNVTFEYGYGQVANPKALRVALNDNLGSSGLEPTTKTHSPIIGFAYDGNPIYGPFAYQDPLDPQSSVVRMTSSYSRNSTRSGGPSTAKYPLGTFTNDFTYNHKSGSLDENNGRFCVTPDYPEGVYAYFITIDSNQVPKYPYILGENFYSLPVDSNYNSDINQNDIPKEARRFYIPGMQGNGEGVFAKINEVKSGTVDSIIIDGSSDNFSVNSKFYFDNRRTDGSEAEALVNSVKGKQVNYIDSFENKVVKLTTIQNAYLFADDNLRQPSSGASGQIVGDVRNDNEIVLKNVIGTFDNTGTFSADIKTFFILLDQKSSYTKGAYLSLTDGINFRVARGEVLNGTSQQNVVEIKVIPIQDDFETIPTEDWDYGDWFAFNQGEYFLQSNDFFNTSGSRPVILTSLSDNLNPFEVNQSVALVETSDNHGLGIDDKVNIDIFPNDATKTKTYYLRKRLYQNIKFVAPKYAAKIEDTGIGRFQILNGGADYGPGTYNNIPLIGGSGTGATASITVSSTGVVNNIVIQNQGTGYRKADYLQVDDESLDRSVASQSTSRLTIYIDHIGFAAGATKFNVSTSTGLSDGNLIKIGDEVIEVVSISGTELTVLRGKEGTKDTDHFDGQEVSLYKPNFNFEEGFQIGSGTNAGYISSYDSETQEATVVYNYETLLSSAERITIAKTFFDSSVPSRLVAIESVEPINYKFEFSEDNITFVANPNIDIQEYYRYKFDTSHPSLLGTYFDVSPSKNYNLITTEKLASTSLPGNVNAFTEIKFGFGSRISANDYSKKVGTDFTNFYYFDKNGVVNAEGSYFKIVQDPLQGEKTVIYVTPTRFVYNVPSQPLWDGSGSISYTTTGQFAVGAINDVKITNLGLNYKKVPIILGVDPNQNYKASARVIFDDATKTITDIEIINKGSNYSKPKVIIIEGDGVDATFDIVARQGEIFSAVVSNPGSGYTSAPIVDIIESDVEAYVESNTIGVPQSISIVRNGGAFHLDKTVSSIFTSKYTVSLISPNGKFRKGETVVQRIGAEEVSRSVVSEWRAGTNLLKLENVRGILREGVEIRSLNSDGATATVKSVFATTFKEKISSFFDNIGYYQSDRGKLGVSNQKITDSFFYQDYSYVVKSKTPIDQWRELIKSTTHPAGFKLFGQVDIETNAPAQMPAEMPKASHFSVIQLWDPNKNKITVENTRRTITQSIQKVENQRIKKGLGSAATSEFNFNESRSFTVTLSAPFDGYYDSDGRLQGTTTFQLLGNGSLFSPVSAKNLIITLDGVLQEPEVAYTVSGDTITFAKPPLGDYQKLTGNNLSEVTEYKGVTFYGRYFTFKDNQYNTRYFNKLRNIFQRSGRWLDSANQLERNRTFIIEESVGYGFATYPNLDWSTKLDDYQRDIGFIIDAYQHDIRFGGNIKTFDFISSFKNNTDYDYITKNKSQSLGIFKYATNLAKLAIRNWDLVETGVSYIQGSKKVNVPDTNRLAIGMHISSGRAFSSDTRIVSIDSLTQITLSHAALANSGGGGGGAPDGLTNLSGTTSGNFTLGTNTGIVEPGNTFAVTPGDELVAPISFSGSDTATFYLSGINSGTYYDASNLILANKEYLQEEISEYIYDTYNLPQGDKTKCKRDLGYLIDAVVYHLRFGGQEKVVEFARLYYTNAGYPYGEELTFINRTDEETLAAVDAWEKLGEKMILAMRNTLGAGTYTTIPPFVDPSVAPDVQLPGCVEVLSSIESMIQIVKDILANGTGAVDAVTINPNKAGYWSDTLTYSNYNIIPDPLLPAQECNDVVSSVDALYDNVQDILDSIEISRSLPDYVDGENKVFELYWEDGSEVNTEEDEDLFLSINAVLQRPKYNADYPGQDSYYIDRTVIPNKLVFDVAPIWDQDFGAKSINEPTAVEKVVGIGVGNYKRLTIDKTLVDGVRKGPFLILDVEDYTVQNIEDKEYFYVFLDGVLQREGYSYTVSGPNIYFKVPIEKEMNVDIRYLYGRDVGQVLNIYDFNPDQYYTRSVVELTVVSGLATFKQFKWMGDKIGAPIHAWQLNLNGTYSIIGELTNFTFTSNTVSFAASGSKFDIDTSLPIVFAPKGAYSRTTSMTISAYTQIYQQDEFGRVILSDNNQIWAGTLLGRTYRNPFVSLSNGDTIRVEGEDKFRKIKKLPTVTTSKEQRNQEPVSNSMFGSVDVERYNGITRGEGLSVIATIENGSVVSLEWNQRNYEPLTQPTAYQYYTPPVLHFIPLDGNGGGARANVLVSKGQVISVDLLDGGSGYTQAPKIEVARRYDILSDRDIGVSLINVGVNPFVQQFNMTASSTVDVINLPIPLGFTTSAVVADSPKRVDIDLEEEIQTVQATGTNLSPAGSEIRSNRPNPDKFVVIDMFTATNQYLSQISGRVDNIISTSVVTANRQITSTVHNLINNTALSNINYYQVGAFLEVDADVADTIIYIADTTKFKTNGFLLIGDEVVRYMRKLSDRFLMVQRGQEGTTAKFWAAGTFIRQIPNPVSIAPGGIISVQSEASVSMVGAAAGVAGAGNGQDRVRYEQTITPDVNLRTVERSIVAEVQPQLDLQSISNVEVKVNYKLETAVETIESFSTTHNESYITCQIQTVQSEFNVRKESLEVLLIPPPSGVIDGYEESVYIDDLISTRLNGFINLDDDYGVIKRNGTIVYVSNLVFGTNTEFIGDYTRTNAGHTISHFDGIFDDGTANVSGLTLLEMSFYFSTLTIRDFTERATSSYTLAGDKFNLMPPSIQSPVAISSVSGTIPAIINVSSTAYFPDSGYLFTSGGTVIQYISKSNSAFIGCTLYRGSDSISSGQEIIPFDIS